MNGFILIFTNYSSLHAVDPVLRSQRSIPLIEENDFIGFNEDTGDFESLKAIDESYRLYFAQDTISQNVFTAFVGGVDRDRLFILRHRLPKIEFEGIPQRNIKVGAHESTGPFYDDVLTCIGDAREAKVTRIFKAVFTHDPILEAKLSLLSAILDGRTPGHLDEPLAQYKDAFSAFLKSRSVDDPFTEDFQAAFVILRDALGVS